jgi:hypothetical protein
MKFIDINFTKYPTQKRAGRVGQVVKYETLSSNPSSTKKKKKIRLTIKPLLLEQHGIGLRKDK